MKTYVCLECNTRIITRKEDIVLRRCTNPRCRSHHVIPVEDYNEIKALTKHLIETTRFGLIPVWDVARAIFVKRGITLTPALTLALIKRLYADIVQELNEEVKP